MPLPPNASIKDVINKLTELEGINQKTELASVIGSPALSTDTVAQQIVKLQDSKDTLASNLNIKGVTAENTEAIEVLASKVADIQSRAYSSGTIISSSNTMPFTLKSGSSLERNYVTVSGLNFIPAKITVVRNTSSFWYITEFDYDISNLFNFIRQYSLSDGSSSNTTSNFVGNAGSAYVNSTGFRLPVDSSSTTYRWYAYQ